MDRDTDDLFDIGSNFLNEQLDELQRLWNQGARGVDLETQIIAVLDAANRGTYGPPPGIPKFPGPRPAIGAPGRRTRSTLDTLDQLHRADAYLRVKKYPEAALQLDSYQNDPGGLPTSVVEAIAIAAAFMAQVLRQKDMRGITTHELLKHGATRLALLSARTYLDAAMGHAEAAKAIEQTLDGDCPF